MKGRPPTKQVADIKARLDDLKQVWEARNRRMDAWMRAYLPFRPPPEPGFTPVPSDLPRSTVDLLTSMLSTPVRIQVPVFASDPTEQDRASKKEIFLRGMFDKADQVMSRRGKGYSLQRALALHCTLRAWYAVRPIILDTDGDPFESFRLYDPRQCLQQFTDKGLRVFAVDQRRRWSDLWASYADLFEAEEVDEHAHAESDLIQEVEWWEQDDEGVWNFVIVDDLLLLGHEKTDFDAIPIVTGPVGGLPVSVHLGVEYGISQYDPSDPLGSWEVDLGPEALWGMSALDAVLPVAQRQELVMGMLLSNMEKHIEPPWVVYTADGKPRYINRYGPEPTYLRGGQMPDKLEQIPHPGPPPETGPLLQELHAMAQRTGIPDAFFGAGGQNLTGFAIDQLQNFGLHRAKPAADAIKFIYKQMSRHILKQYSTFTKPLSGIWYYDEQKRRPIEVYLQPKEAAAPIARPQAAAGRAQYAQRNPLALLPEEAEADDRCDVAVTLELETAVDRMQAATIAAQITRPDNRLVSANYAREVILQVDDSGHEEKLIRREQGDSDQEMAMYNLLEIYLEDAEGGSMAALGKASVLIDRMTIEKNKAFVAVAQARLQSAQAAQMQQQAQRAQAMGQPLGPPQLGPGGPPPGGPPQGPSGQGGSPPGMIQPPSQAMPPVLGGGVPPGNVPLDQMARGNDVQRMMDMMQGATGIQNTPNMPPL